MVAGQLRERRLFFRGVAHEFEGELSVPVSGTVPETAPSNANGTSTPWRVVTVGADELDVVPLDRDLVIRRRLRS